MGSLRTVPALAAAALVWVTWTAQSARADDWRFAADLGMDVRYTRFAEPAPGVERNDSLLAGFTIAGFAGKPTVGYAAAIDVRLGAGLHGGFAYDVALRLLGVGVALGHVARFSTTLGVGAHGHTGHVPAVMRWPFRATLHLELGSRVHLAGFAQTAYVNFADAREQGSASAPFGDEFSTGGYMRLGKGGHQYGDATWGNGYYLGSVYQEMLGERQLVVVLGYGIGIVADGLL